uniref:Uncharacterized protein n=1 Tax=Anguilla anguilla TaxID=7936 RepID=A0A0E9QZ40_ANGAN
MDSKNIERQKDDKLTDRQQRLWSLQTIQTGK